MDRVTDGIIGEEIVPVIAGKYDVDTPMWQDLHHEARVFYVLPHKENT